MPKKAGTAAFPQTIPAFQNISDFLSLISDF